MLLLNSYNNRKQLQLDYLNEERNLTEVCLMYQVPNNISIEGFYYELEKHFDRLDFNLTLQKQDYTSMIARDNRSSDYYTLLYKTIFHLRNTNLYVFNIKYYRE